MNKQQSREKALYRYHTALERGDFATVAAILSQAEQDATLARMLLELNAALETEADATRGPQAVLAPKASPRSTNGQRHPGAPAKERLPMTVYETTYPGQSMKPARNVSRLPVRLHGRKNILTLIAAVIVVALISAALLSSGLPASFSGASGGPAGGAAGPGSLPGAALQAATATATPSPTHTLTPTSSPSPTFLPTVVGPQTVPLMLTATAIVGEATRMAENAFASPMVVTATPILFPPSVSSGTVEMGEGGMLPFPPTAFPPSIEFSTSGVVTAGGGPSLVPALPLGSTVSFGLLPGSVTTFQFTAEEEGALVITTTSLDFTPRLVVVALDDPDLEIQRSADGQSPPTVSVPVNLGDRVLIFIYSVDREATGQFLVNAHMAE